MGESDGEQVNQAHWEFYTCPKWMLGHMGGSAKGNSAVGTSLGNASSAPNGIKLSPFQGTQTNPAY